MRNKKIQYAVQLVGSDELKLNTQKPVYSCGDYQVLAEVKNVGLCFSDLKLLKQFSQHARKSKILSGIDSAVLQQEQSYKPDELPTVPGHEACVEVIAVGDRVKHHKIGDKLLVQADFRWLKTAKSNGAFGYNIEGALQQYITLDERVFVNPETDESFLLPVDKNLANSAVALVEPWTCVESSYISKERRTVLAGGKMIIAADSGREIKGLDKIFASAKPSEILLVGVDEELCTGIDCRKVSLDEVADEFADDIIYFGSDKNTIELLNDKLAKGGVFNIVLGGEKIGSEVSIDVGKVHYGLTRWIGTVGSDASVSYETIPDTGEVRQGDNIMVIGAAGPMGQMHVIRLACCGVDDISITATDFDDERLKALSRKALDTAEKNNVGLNIVNPKKTPVNEKFSYVAIMAPVAAILADAIKNSASGAIINIFAGIPAGTKHPIALDTYIENKCFMFGTSGSTLEDMKIVLAKLTSGRLDTNLSVDAVSGMAGAIDGIRAVESRAISGKIIVYPALENMGLIELEDLHNHYPAVAEKLNNGLWTQQAENELLKTVK